MQICVKDSIGVGKLINVKFKAPLDKLHPEFAVNYDCNKNDFELNDYDYALK